MNPVPAVDVRPLRSRRLARGLLNAACVLVSLFMAVPIYLVALAAFTSRDALNRFPLGFLPADLSQCDHGRGVRLGGNVHRIVPLDTRV